ncbi:Dynamin-2A [Citrus sinensis]|nr:Dynamin-2A [Citrus sinensis]
MEAIEELSQLSDSMRQAAALLADEDVDENSSSSSRRSSTFLNVVALGNVGAGKSAVLNSLIGHPVLPTGENGATRAPISIDLHKDGALSSKSIILQIDNKSQQVSASALRHSLQDRLSKGASGKSRDEIYLKLRTSTAPPLKLIDLPGLDQRIMDDSLVRVSEYAEHNDAILLVIIPAAQAPEIASSRALRVAKEFDGDGTRTVGVISKIDQASADQKALAAVQALLLNQGPPKTADISWVALIGQSVSIATAQSGSESSLETAWRAESESLKSILTGAPQSKLGRIALVDALAQQIRKRMKVRVPNVLSGLQGKSQIVQDELVRLGEQMVQSAEGTRSLALELCREFEDKFLQHITTGELFRLTSVSGHGNVGVGFQVLEVHMGSGWKIVASFEGNFPNRIKQLPLDRHFDINNVKRIVLEADGYQPYLISPEKGLRSLIKGVLELAKEPSRLCVDEVHRVLVDIVSASANATPGLGRYPPFKREVVGIASAALDGFKNEARKMVVALVDMERAFVPPQHFIRLVQRRMERQRREEEVKTRSSKKANEAEQAILNRVRCPFPDVIGATSPQTGGQQTGGSLKAMKDKSSQAEKEANEASALKTAGPEGEITAGFLLKKSAKTNGWSKRWFVLNEKTGKLGYTKKQEERHFRGVIALEECNIEEIPEEEEPPAKSSKDKKANGPDSGKAPSLVFKITSKIPYKTVLKAHNAVVLKAESTADKAEWINKISKVIQARGGLVRVAESGHTMRQSLSDGSLDTMARRPADPEEELRWMSQEVRGYVEAVLNSLAANVPKAVVLCQVEKAKEDMLNQLYSSVSAQSTARIEELLQEDQNVKRRRDRYQKQSELLSKLTRQLSIHDNRAAAASNWSDGGGGAESSPRTSAASGDDWRSAFDAAANGPVSLRSYSRSASNGHSRRYSDPAENGDVRSGSNSGSRRTPNRVPPPPPPTQSGSKYF